MQFTNKDSKGLVCLKQIEINFTTSPEEKEELWSAASYGGKRNPLITTALIMLEESGCGEFGEIEKLHLPPTADDRKIFDHLFNTGRFVIHYHKSIHQGPTGMLFRFRVWVEVGDENSNVAESNYLSFELTNRDTKETVQDLAVLSESRTQPHRIGYDIAYGSKEQNKEVEAVLKISTAWKTA